MEEHTTKALLLLKNKKREEAYKQIDSPNFDAHFCLQNELVINWAARYADEENIWLLLAEKGIVADINATTQSGARLTALGIAVSRKNETAVKFMLTKLGATLTQWIARKALDDLGTVDTILKCISAQQLLETAQLRTAAATLYIEIHYQHKCSADMLIANRAIFSSNLMLMQIYLAKAIELNITTCDEVSIKRMISEIDLWQTSTAFLELLPQLPFMKRLNGHLLIRYCATYNSTVLPLADKLMGEKPEVMKYQDENGNTALLVAADKAHIKKIASLYAKHNADAATVNTRNNKGDSVLFLTNYSDLESLKDKLDISITNANGGTVFHTIFQRAQYIREQYGVRTCSNRIKDIPALTENYTKYLELITTFQDRNGATAISYLQMKSIDVQDVNTLIPVVGENFLLEKLIQETEMALSTEIAGNLLLLGADSTILEKNFEPMVLNHSKGFLQLALTAGIRVPSEFPKIIFKKPWSKFEHIGMLLPHHSELSPSVLAEFIAARKLAAGFATEFVGTICSKVSDVDALVPSADSNITLLEYAVFNKDDAVVHAMIQQQKNGHYMNAKYKDLMFKAISHSTCEVVAALHGNVPPMNTEVAKEAAQNLFSHNLYDMLEMCTILNIFDPDYIRTLAKPVVMTNHHMAIYFITLFSYGEWCEMGYDRATFSQLLSNRVKSRYEKNLIAAPVQRGLAYPGYWKAVSTLLEFGASYIPVKPQTNYYHKTYTITITYFPPKILEQLLLYDQLNTTNWTNWEIGTNKTNEDSVATLIRFEPQKAAWCTTAYTHASAKSIALALYKAIQQGTHSNLKLHKKVKFEDIKIVFTGK